MFKIEQLLIDLYECEVDLNNEKFLLETLELAAQKAKSKIIRRITQKFSPFGLSIILLLAETHISIHTWPEHSYSALDIFICGKEKDPKAAWKVIKNKLKPKSYEINEITRTVYEPRK